MGSKASRRIFIDHYCFSILNFLLTKDDFKSKNFGSGNISVIEGNKNDLDIIPKMTEEVIIYILKPDKQLFDSVIQIDLMLKAIKPNIEEYMIFIPEENYDIIDYMISTKIRDHFKIENLNIDLIPIDNDLLSLERQECLKEIYINNNYTSVGDLANSLVKLEMIFGKVKHKYIKGDVAQSFCTMLEEKEKENDLKTNDEILGMIVLDRSVDFITLMTTNYTCEGLIDDNLGINLGRIKIKESIIKENLSKKNNIIQNDKLISFGLTTVYNPFYCSFRCMHYTDALKYINSIREHYQKLAKKSKESSQKASLDQLKKITEELNYYMSSIKDDLIMNDNLINHIIKPLRDPNYSKYIEKEQVMLSGEMPDNLHNYYDEYLCEQKDLISLMKLMVIESLTQNGIKDYHKLKREILNIYGFQNIFLFRDLEQLEWLKDKQILSSIKKNMTTITHTQIIEKLDLIKTSSNPTLIDDCSYVLGGFCPLSLRIIERAIEGSWYKIIDVLKKIPGATEYPYNEKVFSDPEKNKNIVYIVFVGGINYSEIEGIRFLNRKFNQEYKKGKRKKMMQFVILTTSILNSKKVFGCLGKDVHSTLTIKRFYGEEKTK